MGKTFPTIKTPRLKLRQPCAADVKPLLKMMQDKDVLRYFGIDPFKSEQESLAEVAWYNRIFDESQGIWWIISEKDAGDYIGDVGFFKYEKRHARAEVGYKLSPAFWRRGIVTEALTQVVDYGFAEMDLNRIEALVDPRHTASLRVLEKLHFSTEGILREYEIEKGAPVDLAMLSLLKREWYAP